MKTQYLLIALLSLTALTFQSCLKDKCTSSITYTRFDPVYKTLEEVHNTTIGMEDPKPLKLPGQINYYDDRMFVVETGEGIHVINNADPSNPVNTAFISVPGATDLAIKDGYLFTNSYVDLLVVNLDDYSVAGRTENVLPPLWSDLASGNIIVEYKETLVTEEMDCDQQDRLYYKNGEFFGGGLAFEGDLVFAADQSSNGRKAGSGTGIGGSLSHFTIIGDYLYTIQHGGYEMQIYDLTELTSPAYAKTITIGSGLETLFPHGDKLFIGSNIGMYIYDNADPLNPVQLSVFEHARACDPVFVNDHYAYVTLWDGSDCGAFGPNQLDVIDITDLTNPILLKSFPMKSPHGLSVKGNSLLLCQGDHGFEIFDNTVPETVGDHLLDNVENFHALDVISLPGERNVAMVIGEDGFYQFDFDDRTDLKLLSVIPIEE